MPRHGLRRYSNSVVVVYCLSRTVLRDLPARCAYHTAKSLSKPLRPRIGGKSDLFLLYYTRIRRNCQERRLSQLRFFALFFVLCAPLCPKNERGCFFGRGFGIPFRCKQMIPFRFPRIAQSFSHPNDALFPPPYLYEHGGRRGRILLPFANACLRQKYTKTVLFCQEEFAENHCKNCPIFL